MSIKISELPQASTVNNTDVIPIVQSGTTKKVQAEIINPDLLDTGWISLTPYLNSNYFRERTGYLAYVRRIGKIIYLRGEVYCYNSTGSNHPILFSNLPNWMRPPDQFSSCGIPYQSSSGYNIFVEAWGNIIASQSSTVGSQSDSKGFQLSNLSGYLVDSDFPTELLATTRSLNLTRSANTGELIGTGDRVELTDETKNDEKQVEKQVEQVKEQVENISEEKQEENQEENQNEAEPIETKTEGSGDSK